MREHTTVIIWSWSRGYCLGLGCCVSGYAVYYEARWSQCWWWRVLQQCQCRFTPAPAAESTDDLELAAIAADVLELRSNGCGCGTNHYLMFPEVELVSLMISTWSTCQNKTKICSIWVNWQHLYRLSALQLESDNTASLNLLLHGSQDMPHVFHENPRHRIVHIAYTTGSGGRRSDYTTPHESAGCVAGNVHESQAHTVLGQWMFRPIEKKFQV